MMSNSCFRMSISQIITNNYTYVNALRPWTPQYNRVSRAFIGKCTAFKTLWWSQIRMNNVVFIDVVRCETRYHRWNVWYITAENISQIKGTFFLFCFLQFIARVLFSQRVFEPFENDRSNFPWNRRPSLSFCLLGFGTNTLGKWNSRERGKEYCESVHSRSVGHIELSRPDIRGSGA